VDTKNLIGLLSDRAIGELGNWVIG